MVPSFYFLTSALGECEPSISVSSVSLCVIFLCIAFFSPSKLWTQIKTKFSESISDTPGHVIQQLFIGSLLCDRAVSSLSILPTRPSCPFPSVHRRISGEMPWIQVKANVHAEFPSHSTSICKVGLNKIPLTDKGHI